MASSGPLRGSEVPRNHALTIVFYVNSVSLLKPLKPNGNKKCVLPGQWPYLSSCSLPSHNDLSYNVLLFGQNDQCQILVMHKIGALVCF